MKSSRHAPPCRPQHCHLKTIHTPFRNIQAHASAAAKQMTSAVSSRSEVLRQKSVEAQPRQQTSGARNVIATVRKVVKLISINARNDMTSFTRTVYPDTRSVHELIRIPARSASEWELCWRFPLAGLIPASVVTADSRVALTTCCQGAEGPRGIACRFEKSRPASFTQRRGPLVATQHRQQVVGATQLGIRFIPRADRSLSRAVAPPPSPVASSIAWCHPAARRIRRCPPAEKRPADRCERSGHCDESRGFAARW